MDVVLRESAPEERRRFQLARALTALGPRVPPFAELRKDLERPDGRVLRGVSRAFAQTVVEVLATQGAAAELPGAGGRGRGHRCGAGGGAGGALPADALTNEPPLRDSVRRGHVRDGR